ncbi:MAG: hypothetical protein HOP37_03855, partial [Cyclobacteriaceae bacterium]|nr:hypothetical protein [Cyclobacteriaceae bacterium]
MVLLLVLFCHNYLLAQKIENGDFDNICVTLSTSIFFNAFYDGNNCGLNPWSVSHGTPDIESTFNTIPRSFSAAMAAGKKFGGTVDSGSEGIFQNYNFQKGNRYYLRSYVFARHGFDGGVDDVDEVFISLTNGLIDRNYSSGETADFIFPSNVKQDIWYAKDYKTNDQWVLIEKDFIANDNYSQLWVTLKDNDGNGNLFIAEFKIAGLYVSCCPYDKTITEFTNFNGPLPNYVQSSITAGNKISTTGLVIVPPWSQNVNLIAGKEVVLGAGFAAQNGSFSATVIPNSCNCSIGGGNVQDICNVFPGNVTYIPNANGPGVYVPNYFNRDVSSNWYPSSFGYAKPYNALFWRLTIVNRWGAEVYRAENTA